MAVLQIVVDSSQKVFRLNVIEEQDHQSVEYIGEITEINDMISHLNRKFKKDWKVSGFSIESYDVLVEYITGMINEGLYDITRVKVQTEKNLFYLITSNNLIDFGITTAIDGLFSPENIDYKNSLLIEGMSSDITESLLTSMKLDFGFTNTNNIPFDSNILTLLHSKINILLKNKKIKFINISSKLNKISQLLTSSEVCKLLQISKQTLSIWRKTNKLKYIKKSERIFLYKKVNVMKLMDNKPDLNAFNSSEVCEILQISKQLLMYWRSTKKIKFTTNYKRKIVYDKGHVQDLLTTKLLLSSTKSINSKEKTSNGVEQDIIDWVTVFSHQVTEQKYTKQLFFLNFGKIDITSSPQVMISDEYKLVDVINDNIIIENPSELLIYLKTLNNKSLKPLIDTSKQYYEGFTALYLNKLFKGRILN